MGPLLYIQCYFNFIHTDETEAMRDSVVVTVIFPQNRDHPGRSWKIDTGNLIFRLGHCRL